MGHAKWGAVLALAFTAMSARAQGDQAGGGTRDGGTELQAACIALLNGETPRGFDTDAIRPRCESMIRASVGAAQPGVGTQGPSPGQDALAAFGQAGRELVGAGPREPLGMGRTNRGDSRTLLSTNPVGWFSGLGVNATLSRALESFPKLSLIGSARYARANASNGNVTSVGLGTGFDFFIIGRNNEGLRLGPRFDVSFGTETFRGTTTYARLGASGELGYNFVASNGISVLGAVGLGGRLVGDEQNEHFASFTGGEFGPYVKLGLGYAF